MGVVLGRALLTPPPSHRYPVTAPATMALDGHECSDRQRWANHLGDYLREKHHDDFNNDVQQEARLRGCRRCVTAIGRLPSSGTKSHMA